VKIPFALNLFGRLSLLAALGLVPAALAQNLSVSDNVSVLQGNPANLNISVNGFQGDVALKVAGLPANATPKFDPAIVKNGSATLSIDTTTLTPGPYSLTITATSGKQAKSQSVNLEVCGFQLSASPRSGVVMPGGNAIFAVAIKRVNFTGDIKVQGSVLPPAEVAANFTFDPKVLADSETSSTLLVGVPLSTSPQSFKARLTATTPSGSATDYKDVEIVVGPVGDTTRILLGLEQSGAAAASSTMKFFMDFFISRPLFQAHSYSPLGSPHRWWGDVRIGAVPIQTSTSVSSIGSGLTQLARGLKLNELAQAAEFQTGYEYQRPSLRGGPFTALVHDREYTALGFIAGVGASLPFDPRSSIQYFALPPLTFTDSSGAQQTNQQRAAFNNQYSQNSQYVSSTSPTVAFTTPDRNQFFRQWSTGLRLTTLFEDADSDGKPYSSLGTVEFTVGQNELITGGKLRHFVAHLDAAYPLPISVGNAKLNAFYLFGRADILLGHSQQFDPLLLTPATPPADPAALSSFLASTLVIARPSQRDLYTIGIGVDAIRFAQNLFKSQTAPK